MNDPVLQCPGGLVEKTIDDIYLPVEVGEQVVLYLIGGAENELF